MRRLMKIDNEVEYIVGYKKPPKGTQFKKGKSGNPTGRPKGSRNKKPVVNTTLRSLVINEANEIVESDVNGEVLSLTIAQLIIKLLSQSAISGNTRAQVTFIKMLEQAEKEEMIEHAECYDLAQKYKEKSSSYLTDDGRHLSEEDPKYLPHPDDVNINLRTGDVTFSGPINEKEKGLWEELWFGKNNLENQLAEFNENCEGKKLSEFELEKLLGITFDLELIEQVIAMRWDVDLSGLIPDSERRKTVKYRIDNKIMPAKNAPCLMRSIC